MKQYKIAPIAKPRMTRSDKWNQRDCVMRYRSFADEVRRLKIAVPDIGAHVTFVIAMPSSWSKKKMMTMHNAYHTVKPDCDNLLKALLDALFKVDSHIADIRITKVWGYEASIIVE